MIEAGAQLTQKLDEMGVPISVALWLFLMDINEWRLFFVSPLSSSAGPRVVYEKIQEARRALGKQADLIPFSAIGLMHTGNELVEVLRRALHTGPGINRLRISKNAIQGHFIDDALVYRAAA